MQNRTHKFCLLASRVALLFVAMLCVAFMIGGTGTAIASPAAFAQLYLTRVPTAQEMAARDTHGKFEPAVGCYLGAFIDFDSSLKKLVPGQKTKHQDPSAFETLVQKPHAIYFFYVGYGHTVPFDWIQWLGAQGKFVHVALEPNNGLSQVRHDAYLQNLADGFAHTGAKIFLRFGSEMNGDWVNYYRDPAEFRRKFRLVHDVMKRRAPNVAMVWCPYCPYQVHLPPPYGRVEDYYPGDDGTDWVGVNMYSVTYHADSLKLPGENEHVCDLLSEVYGRYAARKPFMICEFAATHRAHCEQRSRVDFASNKIETLYMALPRVFPRIKAINYFDSNNIQFTQAANNDYSVTNEPTVLTAYRNSILSPYFLDRPVSNAVSVPPPIAIPMTIHPGDQLRGKVEISCFARAPGDHLSLRYKVDGNTIHTAKQPDQWRFIWDAGTVQPGRHTLALTVYNATGKPVTMRTVSVVTAK